MAKANNKESVLIEKMQMGTLTAADLDGMSQEEVGLLHSKAQVLRQALDIEDMQERIAERKRKRQEIIEAHKSQQEAIDKFNQDILSQQAICRHRKGGKNLPGILNGRDSDMSVIIHTYAWGEVMVMCTRCCKEWRKPPVALSKKDPKLYRRQMAEYHEALRFPTDNEPSGSVLFAFQQEPPSALVEAMG